MSNEQEVPEVLQGLMEGQRRIATTLDRPVFVAAGAGSGKTFTLTRRVVWALTPGSGGPGVPYLDSIDQALIITFTEKAAAEIKERLRRALHEAGLHDQALRVDGAWISTIHGMCSRILHRHALDLHINPSFTMGGDHETAGLMAQAVNRVLTRERHAPAFQALLDEYGDGQGPSSLRAMVTTLLVSAGNAPNGFESLSFPDAPAEAEGWARDLLGSYLPLVAIPQRSEKGQSHQAALQADVDGLERFLELPPSQRTWENLGPVLGGLTKPSGTYFRGEERKYLKEELVAAQGRTLALMELERVRPLRDPLMAIARQVKDVYDAMKARLGVLDNDDLIALASRAIREVPAVKADYAGRFRLVMVDEFQDTNAQQVAMIRALAGPDAPLCTVGDAQQSIYRFRGADVDVFRRQQAAVADPIEMTRNFRSSDEVLRLTARICGDGGVIRDFMDLEADEKRISDFPPGAEAPRVYLECVTSTYRGGAKADLRRSQEAAQVADRLARLAEQGVAPGDMAILMRGMTHADVYVEALRERGLDCVIAGGSTFAEAEEVGCVAALLRSLADPADTQCGLYPVLAGEMFRLSPDDLIALASRENEQTGEPDRRTIDRGLRAFDLVEGIEPSERLVRAREVMERAWRSMGRMEVADVLLEAVRASGWLARLQGQGTAGRARAANVLKAIDRVRELCDGQGLGAARAAALFDQWLSGAKEGPASLSGGRSEAVRIMTIHGSKGLEFPVVAVVGAFADPRSMASQGIIASTSGDDVLLSLRPSPSSPVDFKGPGAADPDSGDVRPAPALGADAYRWRFSMEADEAEREQAEVGRLLYVALTRAREALVVSMDLVRSAKGDKPEMAADVIDKLCGGVPEVGTHPFDYGGAVLGQVRVSRFPKADKGQVPEVEEGDEPVSVTVLGTEDADADHAFHLFEVEPADLWSRSFSPRQDVYSYSSAHERALAKGDAYDPRYEGALRILMDDEMIDRADTSDGDRATNLGSAFHELAQLMVETGGMPSSERIARVARAWEVSGEDLQRLREALGRWERSRIRAEVRSWPHVQAEVPFFSELPSEYGQWVTGYLDLLASEGGAGAGGRCLLVDYKTGDVGLSEQQAWRSHEMQATIYGELLRSLGFDEVECAFVLVEREDDEGEPVVLRYPGR